MERISLASYSFNKLLSRGMIDVFGYLESVKYHYNLNYADIWNGFLLSYEDDYLKKIREAMDGKGLELASLCCDWAHPWSDDAEELAKNARVAEDCLRAAVILGAKTVRIDLGVRAEEMSDEHYDATVAAFTKYARFAHDNGFVIGPENHWGASRRLSVQREMYARVNHPGYRTLLHLGNWLLEDGRTEEQTDLAAAPMAAHTHVSYERAAGAHEFLPRLRAAGYEGVWGLEHHTGSEEYKKVEIQLGNIRLANC